MLGPNAICSRIFLTLLITTIVYFAYMNYLLYVRVHDYRVRNTNTSFEESLPNYDSSISCDVNPLCDVTVKSLMLDNPNHYILGPLASIVDKTLGISDCWTWISPNHISAFHVLVAIAAGKCVSSDSLSQRRFGVILFMIRTWLDDLDGHVARRRQNIRGEYSEVGSIGYLVDGFCDALGVLSFLAGVYHFMKNNPPRRGYEKLLPTIETKEFGSGTVYKKKQTSGKEISLTMALLIGQLLFSSAGWNRYIAVYQDLLETKGSFNLREKFQYLLEAGWTTDRKMIGITEPRRVAATSLANRVADEQNCVLGTVVGYSIRFDDCTDENTRIKFMTEGILLREMMADPLLTNYCIIVLDEVHERTLLTDIVMGLLKKIIRKRRSLKIIVSSATVDAEQLRDFFNTNTSKDSSKDTATIMTVEGRLYPVDTYYVEEPVADYVKAVVDTALKIHEDEDQGDILAFLTGMEEVDRAVNLLEEHAKLVKDGKQKILPLAMYGSLPNSEQLKVFWTAPKDTRKIVVATNIAETSITIPGVVYVIDSGFAKIRWFEVETHTDSLIVAPVSKASANQRAGRAGRVRSGKTYRLYTEDDFDKFFDATPPEMQRSDLAPAILQLKALGIDNVLRFNFPSPPPTRSLLSGLELLYALGAINDNGELTDPLGVTMAEMPLEPVYAKCLIISGEMECSEEITTILAMLQVQNVFTLPGGGRAAIKARVARRKFEAEEGDLITLLNVYTAYDNKKATNWCHQNFLNHKALRRVNEIRTQMRRMLKKLKIPLISCKADTEKVLKCITAGLFPNAAYLHYTGVYKTVRGSRELHIHPNSSLYTIQQPQWIIFCEILHTNKTYMRELTVVRPEWLQELAPHFYERRNIDPF